MRKVALVFVLAVFVPSLILAWLAVRSLRDQQFILERQQSLLYQGLADAFARDVDNYLIQQQHEFGLQVEALLAKRKAQELAPEFDEVIRKAWPLAEIGFVVSLNGKVLAPPLNGRVECLQFRLENDKFLANAESAEVYWSNGKATANALQTDNNANVRQALPWNNKDVSSSLPAQQAQSQAANGDNQSSFQNYFNSQRGNTAKRSVSPQSQMALPQQKGTVDESEQFSKIAVAEAEFRQLIGNDNEGTMARFLQNKLNVMTWYRSQSDPKLVFGTQLNLPQLVNGLNDLAHELDPTRITDVCIVILNDTAKPVVRSKPDFTTTNWKHPYAATEIGEALPHWEVAVYLLNPGKVESAANTLKVTLGFFILLLVFAIGMGSWLIVTDLNRQLATARQKTDFVSNVSHELKTPLTSIRMFSELLAEGRVTDMAKQQSYLNIITAETARLTRLINNVLDFSRMERGEKKYHFEKCNLLEVVQEAVDNFRPHLEENQFALNCEWPENPLYVQGDRDALAQIIVNLLSNAEKYSGANKVITVTASLERLPLPFAEVRILDRGIGVPRGCGEKIFEQFFRAHDSLSSGIQGSGLGLTLARQIARAHGGEVVYEPREGGGSCFILRLPLAAKEV